MDDVAALVGCRDKIPAHFAGRIPAHVKMHGIPPEDAPLTEILEMHPRQQLGYVRRMIHDEMSPDLRGGIVPLSHELDRTRKGCDFDGHLRLSRSIEGGERGRGGVNVDNTRDGVDRDDGFFLIARPAGTVRGDQQPLAGLDARREGGVDLQLGVGDVFNEKGPGGAGCLSRPNVQFPPRDDDGLGAELLPRGAGGVVSAGARHLGVEVLLLDAVQVHRDKIARHGFSDVELTLNEDGRGVEYKIGSGGEVKTSVNVDAVGDSECGPVRDVDRDALPAGDD
mmetsp:Transcript_63131/g.186553  ORF Transcript_63131/g.186553 Transcript_63131/m.186553 type:complete len:281 (+) Transcript_63131:2850-3692(+)